MVTSVLHIAKFIPKKKNRKRGNAETINDDETEERRQKTKIDWDLLRKEKTASFNTELKHILEQQQQQTRTTEEGTNNDDNNTWTPDKGCPYENLVDAIETAAVKIAPSNGRTKRPPWFKMNESVLMNAIRERDKATINLKTHRCEENKIIAATKRQALLKAKSRRKNQMAQQQTHRNRTTRQQPQRRVEKLQRSQRRLHRASQQSCKHENEKSRWHHGKNRQRKRRHHVQTLRTSDQPTRTLLLRPLNPRRNPNTPHPICDGHNPNNKRNTTWLR